MSPVNELPSTALLTREQQHILYQEHYKAVYNTVFYKLRDNTVAEDLTNDAYLIAFEKIHTLKEQSKFRSWICTIASNLAKDYIKRNHKVMILDDIDFLNVNTEALEDEIFTKLMEEELKEAIYELDNRYKTVILLRYYFDFSYRDIASYLNLNDNTVKTRLKRAKGKLYYLLS